MTLKEFQEKQSLFKLNPGWTKARMLELLLTKNNGSRAMSSHSCVYKTEEGNRCAVGCFFPDEHPALEDAEGVFGTLVRFPDLKAFLPLSISGMLQLQQIHDYTLKDLHAAFRKFVTEDVIE